MINSIKCKSFALIGVGLIIVAVFGGAALNIVSMAQKSQIALLKKIKIKLCLYEKSLLLNRCPTR